MSARMPGPWWVRRTGEHEPVVYLADIDRLKRDASALLAACEATELFLIGSPAEVLKSHSSDARNLLVQCRAALAKARGDVVAP